MPVKKTLHVSKRSTAKPPSLDASVRAHLLLQDYYRCREGHVWSIPKNSPKAAQTHVTPHFALTRPTS